MVEWLCVRALALVCVCGQFANLCGEALALVGATAAGAYLNAKLHIAKDIRAIALLKYGERNWAKAGQCRGTRSSIGSY